MRRFLRTLLIAGLLGCGSSVCAAQRAGRRSPAVPVSEFQRALHLAGSGHCKQAISRLLELAPRAPNADLARRVGFQGLACARALNENVSTVKFLLFLNRRFPHDPQVLYVTTHAYSDLSLEASEELLAFAPRSIQAMLLDAESYEVQQRWERAKQEYTLILRKYPQATGIHLRIARVDLAEPPSAKTIADARRQLQLELEQDPGDAAAEDVLGGIALKSQQWQQAIAHFSRATKLDAGLTDAYLGLGMAFNSAGRFAQALPPLKLVEKRMPGDATVHYQLLLAYTRLGRKQDAAREMTLFRQTSAKASQRQKQQEQGKSDGHPPS